MDESMKVLLFQGLVEMMSQHSEMAEALAAMDESDQQRLIDESLGFVDPDVLEMLGAEQELSPSQAVQSFVSSRCRVDRAATIERSKLYFAYAEWCFKSGVEPLERAQFAKVLRRAVPGLTTFRPRTKDGGRKQMYRGVSLARR